MNIKIKWITTTLFAILSLLAVAIYIKPSKENGVIKRSNIVQENKSPTPSPTPTPFDIPNKVFLEGGSHAFQSFNNCGPASLSMALSLYKINLSQKELGDEIRPYQVAGGDNDDKSVTLEELAEKGEELGFLSIHRSNGNEKIVKQFVANGMPVITRTLLKEGDDIGHYRVIIGYDEQNKTFIQNDSLQGRELTYTYDSFNSLWQSFAYEYLVLVPKENEALARSILGEEIDPKVAWKNVLVRLEGEKEVSRQANLITFAQSVAYYHAGDYEKSVKAFESIESRLPMRALWYQIEPILAYQKLGMDDEVLGRTQKILEGGNRAFSELYMIRGEIYEKKGDLEKARSEYEKAYFYNINHQGAKEALARMPLN